MLSTNIQNRLTTIVAAMASKGMIKPDAQLTLKTEGERPWVYVHWEDPVQKAKRGYSYHGDTNSFYADDVEEALNKAEHWVASRPSADDLKKQQFLEIVAAAVEVGRQNGIEAALLNPLEEQFKVLSTNILPAKAA
jgi:hypothetical protein